MNHHRFARRRRPALAPPAERHEEQALRAELDAEERDERRDERPSYPPTFRVIVLGRVRMA